MELSFAEAVVCGPAVFLSSKATGETLEIQLPVVTSSGVGSSLKSHWDMDWEGFEDEFGDGSAVVSGASLKEQDHPIPRRLALKIRSRKSYGINFVQSLGCQVQSVAVHQCNFVGIEKSCETSAHRREDTCLLVIHVPMKVHLPVIDRLRPASRCMSCLSP